METTQLKQLKDITLQSEMMDASQISSTFIHKDGTQDVGEINLSGNYIGNSGKIEANIKEVLPSGSIAINGICRTNDSIAIGYKDGNMKNCAIADASLCCVAGKEARGNAFAFGYNAKALNYCACAIGSGTAAGEYSFVACGGEAVGNQSVAFCGKTYAKQSFAHGNTPTVGKDGSYAHAEGDLTHAYGSASHAEGSETSACGTGSHSEGTTTYINLSCTACHAEGASCSCMIGSYSHAEGQKTSTFGQSSHSEGINTIASASACHTEGRGNKVYSNNSHAEGKDNIIGMEGGNIETNGINSHAEGHNNIILANNCHVEGSYNVISGGFAGECHADGLSVNLLSCEHTYAWNGDYTNQYTVSKRNGSFCINPKNGLSGFYIGENNFLSCITKAIEEIAKDQTAKANLRTALNEILN